MKVPSGNIQTYQRSVGLNVMPSARVQAPSDPNAYGANVGQAMEGMSGALSKAATLAAEKQDRDDLQKVLDVSNQMRSDMQTYFHDPNNGMYTKTGENAKGAYQAAQKYFSEANTKYTGLLDNDNQKFAFQRHMSGIVNSYLTNVADFEAKENKNAFVTKVGASVNSNIQGVIANRTNVATIGMFMTKIDNELNASAKVLGQSPEVVKQHSMAYKTQAVSSAITALLEDKDVQGARRTLDAFGEHLDPAAKAKLAAGIKDAEEGNDIFKFKDEIYNNPELKNPDGTVNLEKATAYAERIYKQKTMKTVTAGGVGKSYTWEQTKELVAGNESPNGSYDAVNPDSGAFGKYQFMPDTWRGLMGDAPHTPENQEIAFEKMHKETYEKYGTAGVLVANYAGTQNAGRYMRGEKLLGEGGEYSADAPQTYGGNTYPSVRQYVINALGDDGRQGGSTSQTVSVDDPVLYKKYIEAVHSAVAESQAFRAQNLKLSNDAFDNYLINNKPTTVSEIEAAAKQFGFQGQDLINAIGKGKQVAGLLKLEENQASEDAYRSAMHDIHNGEISSKADLVAKYGSSMHIEKLVSLENFLDATFNKDSRVPAEIQNRDNFMAFSGVLSEMGIKDKTESSKIMEKVITQIKAAKEKGGQVTRSDIEQWTREQAGEAVLIKRPWYQANVKGLVGDVPAGWSIDSEGIMDPNGRRPDKYENGKYYITINGQDYLMPGQGGI